MPKLQFGRPALAAACAMLIVVGVNDSVRAQDERQQTVYVSAVLENGSPVDDLTVDDVIVREDGRLREVLSVTRATDPMDVAVLVDTSAASTGNIQNLRAGVSVFLEALGNGHRVAIVTLAARPTITVDYTTDRARLMEAAEALFAQPNTAGTRMDAIVEVARGLEQRVGTRAVIVPVVFDGAETTRFYSNDVLAALERSGAAMHAVTIGQFLSEPQEPERSLAEVWERGTRDTGGQRILIRVSNALDTVLERLGNELASQYEVTYGRPESLIPPEDLEITPNRAGLTLRGTWARGSTRN